LEIGTQKPNGALDFEDVEQSGGNESPTTFLSGISDHYPDFFLACGAIFSPAAPSMY